MKHRITTMLLMLSLLLGITSWLPFTNRVAAQGQTLTWVGGWGRNWYTNLDIPADLRNVKAINAGQFHNLALKNDGTVVGWGSNFKGETTIPSDLTNVIALATGDDHSVALTGEGKVVVWGSNAYGQRDVPDAAKSGVTAIASGNNFVLALKSDGTVVAWGDNFNKQTDVPAGLSGVVAIAAGGGHSLALKSDGTVQGWGRSLEKQLQIPTTLPPVKAIAAGQSHSMALTTSGTVFVCGNTPGVQDIPANLSDVTAIDAGGYHCLALKSDGTVAAWGHNTDGSISLPALTNVKAISGGLYHTLALIEGPNTAPTIGETSITRTVASPSESSTIATVSDVESGAKGVTVTIVGPSSINGVTVSNLVNNNGTVTADVVAACGATEANFTLRATDTDGGMKDGKLIVRITANPKPVLSYPSNPGTVYGTGITVEPLTGPSDNGNVQSIQLYSITPSNPGGITVGSDGIVTVPSTVPAGNYTVTIRVTDNCGAFTDASFSLGITKATPTITWNNPADITYGTALGSTQLNAMANVAGDYSYSPASGTVLNAGSGQSLSVTFTPTDTNNYSTATKNVSINVLKATPVITWNNPADIIYGTALSATQLNATPNVPGTFSYSPGNGTVLNAGNGQTLSVTFTPTNTNNYNTATKNVSLNVLKATPTITWNNPADIIYGTPLGTTQLSAMTNVPGTFTYNPASGTVLNAGNGQLLSATFTPTDTSNYTTANKSVAINVLKATPLITWTPPTYLLSGSLPAAALNATANIPGVILYTPSAGALLAAGPATLTANFTPSDTGNYNSASLSVTLPVLDNSCGITVNPTTMPAATRGTPFVQTLSASPTGSYVFSVLSGSLPPGVNLVNTLGIYSLRGTPTASGNYTFTIKARKNNSTCEGARTFTIVVP